MSAWYSQGHEGMKREEERLATLYGPQRIWIKPGESKNLVFVDNESFNIKEHNFCVNGDWKNWLTCLAGSEDDVACCGKLGSNSAYFVGYHTAIDTTEYVDKKGVKHAYELKFLPAKMKTLKKFKRKAEDKGLAGQLYKATREDAKSPSCGDEFEHVRPVDMDKAFELTSYKGKKLSELYDKAAVSAEEMEKLKKIFQLKFDDKGKLLRKIVPFNYFELLAPKSPGEVKALLAGVTPKNEKGEGEDDTPF